MNTQLPVYNILNSDDDFNYWKLIDFLELPEYRQMWVTRLDITEGSISIKGNLVIK